MKKYVLLIFFSLMIFTIPITAQTEEPEPETHPLLQMLALVPNIPPVSVDLVSYSDFRAAEAARPATGAYDSWVEYEAAEAGSEEESLQARLWLWSFPGLGAGNLHQYLRQAGRFPEVMGFDLFNLDRAMSFGQPPSDGQIYMGDFDADAITAARTSRGFEQTEIDGFSAWCSPEGCDEGQRVNPAERDPADFFGGHLGRKQPSVLIDSLLFSSADLTTISFMIAAYTDERISLADNPNYVAAAEAITQEGWLRQALFIPPSNFMVIDPMNPDAAEGFDPLPAFELVAIADTATEDQQHAIIALVYNNADNAQTAAEVIPARLEQAESLRTERAWSDIIEERGGTLQAPELYESENGRTVVLFTFSYDPAPDEPDEAGQVHRTAILYSGFIQGFSARDLIWLMVTE